MKLKHRLVISFVLMLCVPFVITIIGVICMQKNIENEMSQMAFLNEYDRLTQRLLLTAQYARVNNGDFILSLFIIMILLSILLIVWMYRSIVPRINEMVKAADNIKDGNLDFELLPKGNDEITELTIAFEEMRQRLSDNAKEKLETEAEQKELLSNIAHDLKTPLTAIKGYAEGLVDGVAVTPEKQQRYLNTICSKAEEMNTLINELSLYSKIDTNRIPYEFKRINVRNYFADVAEETSVDLASHGIKFSYFNYITNDVEIIADPEQMGRVLNNIFSNSIKYMDKDNGHIELRITDVGDFIQIEIEDNGKGIETKDLPYIFDRLYRGDASRNTMIGGTGIGLSIVKKIIEDHGGKIWATSREGDGTCMYFVLRKYREANYEQDIDY